MIEMLFEWGTKSFTANKYECEVVFPLAVTTIRWSVMISNSAASEAEADTWSSSLVKNWFQMDLTPSGICKMLFQPGYAEPWVCGGRGDFFFHFLPLWRAFRKHFMLTTSWNLVLLYHLTRGITLHNCLLVCCFWRAAATTEGAGPKQKKDIAQKKVETVPKKAESVSKKAEPVMRKEETITVATEEEEIETGVCSMCVWMVCGLTQKDKMFLRNSAKCAVEPTNSLLLR